MDENCVAEIKSYPITQDYMISTRYLGFGRTGKIVECIYRKTNLKCALKVLQDLQSSRREIELHWKVSKCEHIVLVKDIYLNKIDAGNKIFLVMECMNGGELFKRIQERADLAFTEREAADIISDICKAIEYLHARNIAHRDLKPENLLYTKPGPDGILKLTDFGHAKEVQTLKGLKTPIMNPSYVAPEILNAQQYDKSCDLWALGVIAYILLCGYPPFYSNSTIGGSFTPGMKKRIRHGEYTFPDREWASISSDAKELIRGLLTTDPDTRFTVDDVMVNHWIAERQKVPDTSLLSVQNMKEDIDLWTDFIEEMNNALATHRVDYDQVPVKSLVQCKNSILEKRKLKKVVTEAAATVVNTLKRLPFVSDCAESYSKKTRISE